MLIYHKIYLKKLPLRNCLDLKDKHLVNGDHTSNICEVLEENLMQCRECLPILAINRKVFYQTFYQTPSSVENLMTVLSFRFSVILSFAENSINYMMMMRDVCGCVKIITPPARISKRSYKNLTKIVAT